MPSANVYMLESVRRLPVDGPPIPYSPSRTPYEATTPESPMSVASRVTQIRPKVIHVWPSKTTSGYRSSVVVGGVESTVHVNETS